jgi:phosphoglucosamine mutase
MLAGGHNLGASSRATSSFWITTPRATAQLPVSSIGAVDGKGKRLSELRKVMTRLPQVLINVRVKEKKSFSGMPRVQQTMATVQKELKERGRMLVRYSGTELLARVMLEGENEDKVKQMAGEIADAIRAEVGA